MTAYQRAVADLLTATLRTLDAGHPVQYGIKELPNGRTATWHHPEIPDDVTERYNRCPTCEQWSPCDVRKAAEAAAATAPTPPEDTR